MMIAINRAAASRNTLRFSSLRPLYVIVKSQFPCLFGGVENYQNRLRPPIGVPRDRRNFIFVTAGGRNYCQFSEQSLNYKSIHAGREDVERSASALATIYDTSVSIGSRVPQFILW